MLLLPRPYPDELMGSMLYRATLQTGIGLKRFIQLITRTRNTSHPSTITRYHSVAASFGYRLDAFLLNHTLYPYSTAFWRKDAREAMTQTLLNPAVHVNVAFLTQNSGKTVSSLRLCPECVFHDVRHYGESYWRRHHQLPGVSYCANHETALRLVNVGVNHMLSTPPPHKALHSSVPKQWLDRKKELRIAQISDAALLGHFNFPHPAVEYRNRAIALGYGLNCTDINTEVLARDFQAYFGPSFLETLGCGLRQVRRPWVSCLVGTTDTNWSPLRHVLLLAFLDSSPTPSNYLQDHVTRIAPRHIDWKAMEKAAIDTVRRSIATHQKAGTRTTVKDLLTEASIFGSYRHNKQRFQNLKQVLVTFKSSSQSERQTGRRPRAYQKRSLRRDRPGICDTST